MAVSSYYTKKFKRHHTTMSKASLRTKSITVNPCYAHLIMWYCFLWYKSMKNATCLRLRHSITQCEAHLTFGVMRPVSKITNINIKWENSVNHLTFRHVCASIFIQNYNPIGSIGLHIIYVSLESSLICIDFLSN